MTSTLVPLVVTLLLFWAKNLSAEQPPQFPKKVDPYPVVADITFAEGPAFDSKGNLYFVNYLRYGTIGRKTLDGTVGVWVDLNGMGGSANGLKADKDDNIVVADPKGKRLLLVSPKRKITVLADRFDGKSLLGPNDIALDKAGNIFFTDPSGSSREKPIGGLYRYSVERKLTRLDDTLAFPNGLAVSPDQKRLYVAEMFASRILAYDLSADGSASNRRVLYQFPPGNLDGIGFDEYSRLWVTRPEQNVVDVVTETGELAGSIPTGKTVTNLAWWGKSVYLTIAGEHSIHRLDLGIGSAR